MDNVEESSIKIEFVKPTRSILNISDVSVWLKSEAHNKYMKFIRQLNNSVKGISTDSDIVISENAKKIIEMLNLFQNWTEDYPPEDMGTQRFGNKSYRKWYARLTSDAENALLNVLPMDLGSSAQIELLPYLFDSFGNSTRIDYGSGHEASFLIFLFCLYQIGFLTTPGDDCSVVLRVFHRYLKLVKHLQNVYRMEPAGSRGVHAIDDFQFLPFLFGNNKFRLIPDYYLRPEMVSQYQNDNLFFEAIHAVQTWERINEGMFKMYEGEVLKKFPVVQHFLFGSLFSFKESEEQCGTSIALGLDSLAKGRHPSNLGIIQE